MLLKFDQGVHMICLRGIDHSGSWFESKVYQESNAISEHVIDRRDLKSCIQEESYKQDKESMKR